MTNCCRECHFLAKSVLVTSKKLSEKRFFPWTNEERSEGKTDEDWWTPCCQRGVWDTDIAQKGIPSDKLRDEYREKISKLEEVIDKNRKDNCFFIEYREGMSFEGATELHRMRYDNRHLKRSFRTAIFGLYTSAVAASLNFIGFDNVKKGVQIVAEWISTAFRFFG